MTFYFKTSAFLIAIAFLAVLLIVFWILMALHSKMQKRPFVAPCPDRWTRDRKGYCLVHNSNQGDLSSDYKSQFINVRTWKTWAEQHGILWDGLI